MNLRQIGERVQNELSWAPTTTAWVNDRNNVINDHYQTVMSSERWTFRTVEHSMRVYADVTGVQATFIIITGFPVSLRSGAAIKYADYDATILRAADETDSLRRYGRIAGTFPRMWRQAFRRTDSIYLEGFPDPDGVATPSQTSVYMDEPQGVDSVGAFTDCILRHDRYHLPYDCAEIIGIVSRDTHQREVSLVNRTAERSMVLSTNQDAPGVPSVFILDDPEDAGPAPRKTMTGTNAAGGSMAAGTYRFFYAFWGKGCYSGPSNIISVVVAGGGTAAVDLANMEGEGSNRYWRNKHVFQDDGDGVFRFVMEVANTATTATITGTGLSTVDELHRWDDRMATPHKTIRLYPRPSEDMWLSVSYLRMPGRLVTPQDVPEMPEEYHRLLVHRTVATMASRADGQERLIKHHMQQAAEVESLMLTREVGRYSSQQRKPWSPGAQFRFLGPVKAATFTG